jgi:hypothetical protein
MGRDPRRLLLAPHECIVPSVGPQLAGLDFPGVDGMRVRPPLDRDVNMAGLEPTPSCSLQQPLRGALPLHQSGPRLRLGLHISARRTHALHLPGLLPRLLHGEHRSFGRVVRHEQLRRESVSLLRGRGGPSGGLPPSDHIPPRLLQVLPPVETLQEQDSGRVGRRDARHRQTGLQQVLRRQVALLIRDVRVRTRSLHGMLFIELCT